MCRWTRDYKQVVPLKSVWMPPTLLPVPGLFHSVITGRVLIRLLQGNERLLLCVTEHRYPYGSQPFSDNGEGKLSSHAFKTVFTFQNCMGCNFCCCITLTKKQTITVAKITWNFERYVSSLFFRFFWVFFKYSLSDSCSFIKKREEEEKIKNFPLLSWPSRTGSLTLILEVPFQSAKVHKDKILTILRTIGSLRT